MEKSKSQSGAIIIFTFLQSKIHTLFENIVWKILGYTITFQLQCFYVAGGYLKCSDETLVPI